MVKVDSNKHMRPASCRRIVWVAYAKFCTCLIPNRFLVFIGCTTLTRRKAWREKVALFLSYLIVGGLFCFWLEFITALFCSPEPTFPYTDVFSNSSKMSGINGFAVDYHKLGNSTELSTQINLYPGLDLSPMFPMFMQLQRSPGQLNYDNDIIDKCIRGFNKSDQADNWLKYLVTHDLGYVYKDNELISCPIPGLRNVTGAPCFYTTYTRDYVHMEEGAIEYDAMSVLNNFNSLPFNGSDDAAYVILDGMILDVTEYLVSATNVVKLARGSHSRAFALDRMFLPLDLTILLFTSSGLDITAPFYDTISDARQFKDCLWQLFGHGTVGIPEEYEGCAQTNLALWITMGTFLLYFLIKMNLANLSRLPCIQKLLFKSIPPILEHPYTLMLIPCYAEPSETIRQTFDSLARNNYPDTRKLLFFVCDGLAQSKSDGKETYLCILEALGYSSTKDPEIRSYFSLGQGTRKINYAKVYAGFYESGRNRVPFLMIVKVGSAEEGASLDDTRIPGNRGKRDSMVIVLSFLERCMNLSHNRMTPLEFELFNQCYNLLGIDPRWLKYMLVTDADVQVQDDVVSRMVSRLEADTKLVAINGHIRPANPEENLITMLQIFPIYMTFYSALAYEACLGRVTTINGGFIMYRLWSESTHSPPTSHHHYRMQHLSPHPFSHKQPKVSDEMPGPDSTIVDWKGHLSEEDDDTSSDDNFTTTSSRNKTNNSSRRRMFTKNKKSPPSATATTKRASMARPVSLAPSKDIQPICMQPTVLRGFATPRPDTMHMENVLLLGEEQYLGIVLLRSFPNHRIGFEPEAIAYMTAPTNFFALQALQTRYIRFTFHTLIEFQHVAKHLGLFYWLMSFTKLLDIIFLTPIIVYLYGIFIRYFLDHYEAYKIIALSFTGLIVLHMFYFMIRRQFKYVIWFIIYGLFSIPIFNVYFPLLAIWNSDSAHYWNDVWPTPLGYKNRLHGLVQQENEIMDMDEQEAEEAVIRMRLHDFEILEAERLAQREKEQAEMLDAKFNGFTTSYVGTHASKPSWSSSFNDISSPAAAQIRHKTHSRLTSEDDARFLLSPNRSSTPRTLSMNSSVNNSPRDPFVSALDNPFDDVYTMPKPLVSLHKASHSQSSYFSGSDYHPGDMFQPHEGRLRSFSASGAGSPYYTAAATAAAAESVNNDSSSVISLTNSIISLERDASPVPVIDYSSGRRRLQPQPQDEGRSAPVHSRIRPQP